MGKYSREKSEIKDFIENDLEEKLKKDQKNLKILSEGDLQSCVYFHLREFFGKDKITDWHILNKLPMGERSEREKIPYIAILYLRSKGKIVYPSFIIELKEDIRFRPRRIIRDLNKLSLLAKKYKKNIEQTYFIYSILDKQLLPEEINDLIYEKYPTPQDGYLIPMAINIMGEKQFPREMINFEKKVNKLRKFRN